MLSTDTMSKLRIALTGLAIFFVVLMVAQIMPLRDNVWEDITIRAFAPDSHDWPHDPQNGAFVMRVFDGKVVGNDALKGWAIISLVFVIPSAVLQVMYLRTSKKQYLLGFVLLFLPVLIALHALSYLLVYNLGSSNMMRQIEREHEYRGQSLPRPNFHIWSGGERQCERCDVGYAAVFYTRNSPTGEHDRLVRASIFAAVAYVLSFAAMIVAYLFASSIEGPTLSEYVTAWSSALVGGGKAGGEIINRGFHLMKERMSESLSLKKVLAVRAVGDEHYREIELHEFTYEALEQAVADVLLVPSSHVERIVRHDNVLVNTDEDVARLRRDHRLEVSLERDGGMEATVGEMRQDSIAISTRLDLVDGDV